MASAPRTGSWFLDDLAIAAGFLTRLPVPQPNAPMLMRAGWAFPVVGAGVGLVGGAVLAVGGDLGLPAAACALLAIAATALLTGGLHEDGLADLADGFAAPRSKERTIEIMRDPAIGTYGVLALVLATGLKLAALVPLVASGDAVVALLVAHALGRGALIPVAERLPHATSSGLAHAAGRPPRDVAVAAVAVAAAIALLLVPFAAALAALLASGAVALAIGGLARRRLDGITGDVLGGIEQLAETAVLLALAATLGATA